MGKASIPTVLLVALGICVATTANASTSVVYAVNHGLVGDGLTNDGPAIASMVAAGRAVPDAVQFVFPTNSTIRVETYPEDYLFAFTNSPGLEIEGGGSTFILDPALRFLSAQGSSNVTARNLNIDFDPLPFAQGTLVSAEPDGSRIYVDPDPGMEQVISGGPVTNDDQQAFYSFIWTDGAYGLKPHHYWTQYVSTSNGIWAVEHDDGPAGPDTFVAGLPAGTIVCVPIPGIAGRMGPGAVFDIDGNHNATLDTVEVWSAPWMANAIYRNSGEVNFTNAHVRPKPGSARYLASWRDAFHVKGNSASILFDGCHIEATGDDAFNISTHSKRLEIAYSPTHLLLRQQFVLEHIPLQVGHELVAADRINGRIAGRAQVTSLQEIPSGIPGHAPQTEVWLDQPLSGGLDANHVIWQPDFTNPDTTLRNCTIRQACRFQNSVTLEDCDITALAWFYGNDLEGPGPEQVVVRDSVIRRGSGNDDLCLIINDYESGATDFSNPRLIDSAMLENCDIYGTAQFSGINQLSIAGCRFLDPARPPVYANNQSVTILDYDLLGQYTFNDTGSGTVAQRMPVAMGATNEATGVMLSQFGTNTTTRFDFGGFNNLPPTDGYDGFSFGNNSGDQVMFLRRAASSSTPSAFDQNSDTSAAVQPFSFTVSADATHDVVVSNIVVNTGSNGTPTIYALQEAGTARGTTVTYGASYGGTVSLDAPVVVEAGTSKTFTIHLNSGAYGSLHYLNNIEVKGLATFSPVEAATIWGISPISGSVKMVVDAPDVLSRYWPEGRSDLSMGSWGTVAHSDNADGSFTETNLSYSATEGTHVAIYLQIDATNKFFRIQGE
ncbi:MAG: hypothetical protein ABFR33_05070 [Verrucomicrobiota bacterium]